MISRGVWFIFQNAFAVCSVSLQDTAASLSSTTLAEGQGGFFLQPPNRDLRKSERVITPHSE